MRADHRADALRHLLRDEVSRTIELPTRRFGRPCLVSVTCSVFGRDDTPREPLHWIVEDATSGDLVAVARTRVVTPLPGWTPPVGPFHHQTALEPLEELEVMRAHWQAVRDGFVLGNPVPPGPRAGVDRAIRSQVPRSLQAWLFECCGDFVAWLRA